MVKTILASNRFKKVRGGFGGVAPAINIVKKAGLSLLSIGLILAQVGSSGFAMAIPGLGL
ncbi:MAG: hypothetical protein KDJ65_07420 [Anaerolineae bacterium]|nr:hypothetical protein [Anaerolineae bacterium]